MAATYPDLPHAVVEALCRHPLKSKETRVFACVLRHTYGWNGKADGDWLSNKLIVEETEMSKGTVSKAMASLLARRIVMECDDSTYRRRTYRVNEATNEWLCESPQGSPHLEPSAPQEGFPLSKPLDAKVSMVETFPPVETIGFPLSKPLDAKKVSPRMATQEGPRSRSKATDTKKGQEGLFGEEPPKRETTKAPKIDPNAETIYQAYPKKRGHEIALTAITKALIRLRSGSHELADPVAWLTERVKAYAASDEVAEQLQIQKGKFLPYPATWFNQGRYDDEDISAPKQASPHVSALAPAPKMRLETDENGYGRLVPREATE